MKPPALRFYSLLFISLLFTAPVRADLDSDVHAVLANSLLHKARWSVKIVQLDAAGHKAIPLLDSNADSPMVPASNLKVITTSATLDRLGPDFKFRTLLVQHGPDLFLIGDGDPTFGDAELLKKSGWDVTTVFKVWARGLAQRKVGPFQSLQVDASVFDSQFVHPHWPADQADKRYVAAVAGLNLNANCLDVYVKPRGMGQPVAFITDPPTSFVTIKNTCVGGSDDRAWLSRQPGTNELILHGTAANANDVPIGITIDDPPMFAGAVLAETFASEGIRISAITRTESARAAYSPSSPDWKLLALHETPLLAVISRANKDSMNLYAEACCKRLGFATAGVGSWTNGTAAVGDFLHSIGVPPDQFHLDDGCGLSKENNISANLMVSVLTHDFFSANSKAFLSTLAVAGVDGTMEDRFRGTNLRGRVFAKSGFVNGVSCLSGYLQARDQTWFAFSILFNDVPPGGTADAKALEERIVRAIDVDCSSARN